MTSPDQARAWAAALPPVPADRLAVRVTADAERQIRGGHPWVYADSITSVGSGAAPGTLAVVFDRRRAFCGIGLWDPTSPIAVRILHAGSPTRIDPGWFAAAIGRAAGRRAVLETDPATDAYRVVHGENDGLPGLVVDRYADRLVVELFSSAWLPHLPAVVDAVVDRFDPAQVVLRLGRTVAAGDTFGLGDGAILHGDRGDTTVWFRENGLRFGADLARGQKTGHFLDQRDNRARVRDLARGARALDAFCCTGGFSVHAAAGGAVAVLSTDRSEPALASTRSHMKANAESAAVDRCDHRTVAGDAFDVLDDLVARRRRFDLVVVDPPSFASRRSQVPAAIRAYERLAASAVRLVEPGGTLVQASCSSRIDADTLLGIVEDATAAAGRRIDDVTVTGHAVDHPIGFAQGAYLDAVFCRLR